MENKTKRRIKANKKIASCKDYKELDGFKTKGKRLLCDCDGCKNYAFAELYRLNKGWMYVCKTHYTRKINKCTGKPKERGVAFCILKENEKRIKR